VAAGAVNRIRAAGKRTAKWWRDERGRVFVLETRCDNKKQPSLTAYLAYESWIGVLRFDVAPTAHKAASWRGQREGFENTPLGLGGNRCALMVIGIGLVSWF
jgi:hypothetical protein